MSVSKLPRELAGKVIGGASHAVRHPVESAAYGAGIVLGAATVVRRLKHGHSGADRSDGPSERGVVTEADLEGHTTSEPPSEPQRVGLEPGERLAAERAEAVTPPPARPGKPGEQFETDPQASSRDSEHGGPGDDSELDVLKDWPQDPGAKPDLGTPDVTTPVGTAAAGEGYNPDTAETDLQQPDTEPLMDPSLTKAIKSESDTMRKGADRDKSTDQID
ncbi:MAG TPA: hypothetical protein VFK34_13615 [Marmoricola sp.]|jgi:hypothetical protein|nr:hypothetical protein [Marmoricola sp.]